MKNRKFLLILFSILAMLILIPNVSYTQTKVLEDFEGYVNTDSLAKHWGIIGDASKDYALVEDTAQRPAPGGTKYFKYTYNASTSTWGGAAERTQTDASFFPLALSSTKGGLQFYLKGDGTNNVLRFRYYQFFDQGETIEAVWRSHAIPLNDTTWHIVRIPFILDSTDSYGLHLFSTNGPATQTEEDMKSSLGVIARFQINLDTPNTLDQNSYSIYFDDFRAVDFMSPVGVNAIKIADYEEYIASPDFQAKWQGFGYGTLDYELARDNQAPEGYKNAIWFFKTEERTTWGVAFRSRQVLYKIPDLSNVSAEGGIQFLLKGDGTKDLFFFRFMDAAVNFWGSHWISLEDTTWHLVTIPLVANGTRGFRWLGNDPNQTIWDAPVGTDEQLRTSLKSIMEVRIDKRFFNSAIPPYIPEPHPVYYDTLIRSISIDAIYAVDKFPALPAVAADDFETYVDSDNLRTIWNQFGTGSVSLDLSTIDSKSGAQAMSISYNGANGYTGVRKRNIIPGLNFSELKGGMQFWSKGDGSNNTVVLRLMSGNEMWESAKFKLNQSAWQHLGVQFKADSINGFRYLGNDPDNPVWSTDVGTDEQLKGDLANIDQIRFYVRDPEAIDEVKTIVIDKVEGVDEFDGNVAVSVEEGESLISEFTYSLMQNYPNPFNPNTAIQYSLKSADIVALKVYNVLGQEVITLVNEYKNAGKYQVNFNATNLASGIYIYQLKAGSFISSKKMILLK